MRDQKLYESVGKYIDKYYIDKPGRPAGIRSQSTGCNGIYICAGKQPDMCWEKGSILLHDTDRR